MGRQTRLGVLFWRFHRRLALDSSQAVRAREQREMSMLAETENAEPELAALGVVDSLSECKGVCTGLARRQ